MAHRGMIGRGPLALRIIFALMDSDSDGTVSLQEFQAAHDKIFKAMDANKDGVLTLEEMQAFMHGSRGSAPAKARSQDKDESDDEDGGAGAASRPGRFSLCRHFVPEVALAVAP